jgi:hypothetical protein
MWLQESLTLINSFVGTRDQAGDGINGVRDAETEAVLDEYAEIIEGDESEDGLSDGASCREHQRERREHLG